MPAREREAEACVCALAPSAFAVEHLGNAHREYDREAGPAAVRSISDPDRILQLQDVQAQKSKPHSPD